MNTTQFKALEDSINIEDITSEKIKVIVVPHLQQIWARVDIMYLY